MVVRDDDLRALVRRMLEGSEHDVLVAADAAEALDAASSAELDLLLTEVGPGIHGRSIAERLRAGNPALRVLFITDHPGLTEPGETTLQKPFSRHEFRSAVALVVGGDPGL